MLPHCKHFNVNVKRLVLLLSVVKEMAPIPFEKSFWVLELEKAYLLLLSNVDLGLIIVKALLIGSHSMSGKGNSILRVV